MEFTLTLTFTPNQPTLPQSSARLIGTKVEKKDKLKWEPNLKKATTEGHNREGKLYSNPPKNQNYLIHRPGSNWVITLEI